MKRVKKSFIASMCFLAAFAVWTVMICCVDVYPIGPRESSVGFAGINQYVHGLTGVHFTLYHITDWLGLVPVAVCFGFAILGLVQWVKRKHIIDLVKRSCAVKDILCLEDLIYKEIDKVSDSIKPECRADAGKNIFGVWLDQSEREHKEWNTVSDRVRDKMEQENKAEYRVFCLNGVEDKRKSRSYTEKRNKISEETVSSPDENRCKDRIK